MLLVWNQFECELGSRYLMFGIWSQVVGSQISFGDSKYDSFVNKQESKPKM